MVFLKARGQSERTRHRPRATGASFFIGIRDAVADAAFWLMKFNEWMEMLRSLITEREVKQNKKKEGISQVTQLMFREPQTWNYLDPLSWKHRQYNRPDGPLDWEVAPAQSASEEHESSSSFFSPLCADIFILKLFPFPLALCLRVARPASMGSDRETWWVPLIRKRVGREDSRSFIDFWPVSSYFLASIASSETRGKK